MCLLVGQRHDHRAQVTQALVDALGLLEPVSSRARL